MSVCVAMLTGCGSEHSAFALTYIPTQWQAVSEERYGATNCPAISGSYKSKGTARVLRRIDGKLQPAQDESVGAWRIGYSQRLGSRELLDSTDSRVPLGLDIDEVRIAQLSETRYEVYRPQKGGKIDVSTFDSTWGDFHCADGIIHLAIKRQDGSSEGTTRHSELTSSIRIAPDGALIVKQQLVSGASSLLLFRSEIITEDYARFTRVLNTK